MSVGPEKPESLELETAIDRHLRGEPDAAETICALLTGPVRTAARIYLGDEHPEVPDVIQETLIAVLEHLRRTGRFEGDLIRFAVTVARNRCRNLLNWRKRHPQRSLDELRSGLADPGADPLQILLGEESLSLLQQALDQLGEACRELLHAFYIRREPADSIRRRYGLRALQSVYYRKSVCLDQAHAVLEKRLAVCSRSAKRDPDPSRRAEGEERS